MGLSVAKRKELPRKTLNVEEYQRRQKHALAMLENAPADPMGALEEKYRANMLATEHERNTRAIRGTDIYEDDAELDLGKFISDQKQERVGDIHSGSVTPPSTSVIEGSRSGDPELDSLLA